MGLDEKIKGRAHKIKAKENPIIYVMAMNSQGNQAPRMQFDSESINRRFDEERLTPNIDATVNPSDVLCGRGKSSFTHGK